MARPKGSTNKPREIADTVATQCPKCGSTRRTPYKGTAKRREAPGVYRGTPYTAIVYRRTQCEDCGQHRIDREFLFEPDSKTETA